MRRAKILICPNCDYKRYLTEAESLISYALIVACLKCGSAMQCVGKPDPKVTKSARSTTPEEGISLEEPIAPSAP